MLHDVVVHVHQNPERGGESDALSPARSGVGHPDFRWLCSLLAVTQDGKCLRSQSLNFLIYEIGMDNSVYRRIQLRRLNEDSNEALITVQGTR